jgi:hypothetical protein
VDKAKRAELLNAFIATHPPANIKARAKAVLAQIN